MYIWTFVGWWYLRILGIPLDITGYLWRYLDSGCYFQWLLSSVVAIFSGQSLWLTVTVWLTVCKNTQIPYYSSIVHKIMSGTLGLHVVLVPDPLTCSWNEKLNVFFNCFRSGWEGLGLRLGPHAAVHLLILVFQLLHSLSKQDVTTLWLLYCRRKQMTFASA